MVRVRVTKVRKWTTTGGLYGRCWPQKQFRCSDDSAIFTSVHDQDSASFS